MAPVLHSAFRSSHRQIFRTCQGILLNYGANPNAPWGILNPMHRELDTSILQFAILILEQLDPSIHIGNQIQDIESMVDFLLEKGTN